MTWPGVFLQMEMVSPGNQGDIIQLFRKAHFRILKPSFLAEKQLKYKLFVRSCETNLPLELCSVVRHQAGLSIAFDISDPNETGDFSVTINCKGSSVCCSKRRSSPVQIVIEFYPDSGSFPVFLESKIFCVVDRSTMSDKYSSRHSNYGCPKDQMRIKDRSNSNNPKTKHRFFNTSCSSLEEFLDRVCDILKLLG